MRAIFAVAVVAACARANPDPPAPEVAPIALPPIAVADYPEPPQQHAAWTAPTTTIPVDVARKLFDLGLADPRGCEYRAIELDAGEAWSGSASPVQTRGWVLPGTPYAVAMNGLVYRTRSIGAPVDVAKDTAALLDADAKAAKQSHRTFTLDRSGEHGSVAADRGSATQALLLLRAGQVALAERIWKQVAHDASGDRYGELAGDWLWDLYERGITAHMRGDVALAIESWRRLPALAKTPGLQPRDVGFLADIDAVLADERRRAAHPTPPIDLAALAKRPQTERIARLIVALDQVAARQMAQPGGVALGEDPIVQALIKEGEPAVEPLIAAYEHDDRRTRSVQFWRDFSRDREVLTTYEAAYNALSGILDMSFFEPASTGDNLTARGSAGRGALGEQVRAYWQKWHGISIEERYYRMLADDHSNVEGWLRAAHKLTQPTNVSDIPSSSIDRFTMTTALAPGQTPKLRGEAMRAKTSPSVTALFERRLAAMTTTNERGSLLEAFAAWDPAAAGPELARFIRTNVAAWSGLSVDDRRSVAGWIAWLTTLRFRAGDPGAIADYAAWVVDLAPADCDNGAEHILAPMIDHQDAPEIRRAATTMFGTARSPWLPLASATPTGDERDELVATNLVRIPAVRDEMLVELTNQAPLGVVTIEGESYSIQFTNGSEGGAIDSHDPLAPRDGTVQHLRVADLVAYRLGENAGAPPFRRYWTRIARDQAIVKLGAWLRAQ